MTFELHVLVAATVLGLVHLGASSFAYQAQVGRGYAAGPRDEGVLRKGLAGRLHRAQYNFLETYVFFAALVLLVYLTGRSGTLGQWGAGIYLTGRIVYLPLYAWGVPLFRSLVWNAASVGLILIGVQLYLPGNG